MAITVNQGLLPVKAHYLFFFAALGPVLPQLNVYGRQLGVSPEVMGLVTAVLPLLWAVAKPGFGFLVDYFTRLRKQIFIVLIIIMSSCYCSLWFLPQRNALLRPETRIENIYQINDTVYLRSIRNSSMAVKNLASNIIVKDSKGRTLKKYECYWSHFNKEFDVYFLDINKYLDTFYVDDDITNTTCTNYGMVLVQMNDKLECRTNNDHHLICIYDDEEIHFEKTEANVAVADNVTNVKRHDSHESTIKTNHNDMSTIKANHNDSTVKLNDNHESTVKRNDSIQVYIENMDSNDKKETKFNASDVNSEIVILNEKYKADGSSSIYGTVSFWGFVILMSLGTVAFNVANCISDAICFDVLGPERASAYGAQRAWGTAGYGVCAFVGGWLVDLCSTGGWKDFTPAFVLAAVFTVLDVVSCRRLTLPRLTSAESASGALRSVLVAPRVLLFITFAVVAGMLDSFIVYYLFWYVEELAEAAGDTANVKLLEGVIVLGQSFVGEIIFFFLSGRILDRFGHGATMTFCLVSYGVRLACVSVATDPWILVPIEAVMQGPTYALCYATIVGYAASVAPEGHSATMQGIVAGMDDGVGFALGSLLGGQLYGRAGGRGAFRAMALVALVAGGLHAVLHYTLLRTDRDKRPSATLAEGEKMLERARSVVSPHSNGVYCDTVVPLREKSAPSAGDT